MVLEQKIHYMLLINNLIIITSSCGGTIVHADTMSV